MVRDLIHRRAPPWRRLAVWLVVGALSLGLVAGAFIVGRTLGGGETAVAEDKEPVAAMQEPPGPDVMADPLATPDTSEAWWYVPYQNLEDSKPRYEQTVAGIRIGPEVERQMQCTEPDDAPPDESLQVTPKYLPPGAVLFETQEGRCSFGVEYDIVPDPGAAVAIKSGERSYFDVNHGGKVDIYRLRAGPAFESNIASERWFEGTVAGRPAAIGAPMIDAGTEAFAGMGQSMVIIHEDGLLTVVRADDISLAELLRIAEGVFE